MRVSLFRRNNEPKELPSMADGRIDFRVPSFEATMAAGSPKPSTNAELVAQTLVREQVDFETETDEA